MSAVTVTPAAPKSDKKAAAPKKGATVKGAKARAAKPTPKTPKYDPVLVAAVRYARMELHAKRPGLGDRRPAAASVGDHAAVRAAIAKMIDGSVTPESVLKITGVKSVAALERVARFDPASSDDLTALRDLGKKVAPKGTPNQAWRTGRYLAGIVAAWIAEMKAAKS